MTKENTPRGFDRPTELPHSEEEAKAWQEANRSWWERHPMRYDSVEQLGCKEFSCEFYQEMDRRFFALTWKFMPWKRIPFDPIIDFGSLDRKDVLEIGVGGGSHAGLLAKHAGSFAGIDLTDYAVKCACERLKLMGLRGRVERMDAESMSFDDESFDFIWSWGVIHHSSNTEAILREMHRVLRRGGTAITMVYHRNWWNYYVMSGFHEGIVLGGLWHRGKTVHQLLQETSDGAIARHYTIPEWKELASTWFTVDAVRIYGNKPELLPWGLPVPERLMALLLRTIPNPVSRFLTNTCRMGRFLVAWLSKR